MEFFAIVRQNMLFIFQHYQNVWATILVKRDGRHFINIDLFKKVMIQSHQPPPPPQKEVEQTNKHNEDKEEDISPKTKQKVLE